MGIFDRLKKKKSAVDRPSERSGAAAEASEPSTREETARTPAAAVGPRFRIADVTVTPLGDGNDLVQLRGTANARVVPEFLSGLLRRCREFATLEDHAQELIVEGLLDPAERGAVLEDLNGLVEEGLLVRADEVKARIRTASHAGATGAIRLERVALITANRVELARRCLESWADAERAFGRCSELLVFDDSRDAATRADYRAMLEAVAVLAREHGASVRYAGWDQKRAYAAALAAELGASPSSAEHGSERALIDFALFGAEVTSMTAGANRNAVLLECAGTPVLSADDDTLWKRGRRPDPRDGLALSSVYDPTELWFYPDQSAALAAAELEACDWAAAHESLLGRTVGECVADADRTPASDRTDRADRIDLERAAASFLSRLESGRGRVVVTNAGVVGDSGMGSTAYYLLRRGSTRERLIEDYERNHLTRAVFRSVAQPTISEGSFLTMTSLGLDLRSPVPPFFPVLRNTDGVFGVTLRVACADAYLGHLPAAVAHQPMDRASTMKDLLRAVSATRCDEVVMAGISTCTFGPEAARLEADPALRFLALGRHLVELARLPRAELIDFVRSHRSRRLAETSSFLVQSLALYGEAPAAWARDVRSMIEAIRATVVDPARFVPSDLLDGSGADAAWDKVQRLLKGYGELLISWPAVTAAAERLSKRGVRMTVPIRCVAGLTVL